MYTRERTDIDAGNLRALLLEIIRRAAYDWVIYRGNRKLAHRKVAKDAYVWLFIEKPGHPDWVERQRTGWSLFSFLGICDYLDFNPDIVRAHIKKLTSKKIQSMGRPPTRRLLPSNTEPECFDIAHTLPEQFPMGHTYWSHLTLYKYA